MRRLLPGIAVGAIALAGCGEDFPVLEGGEVVHEWEVPDDIGGTVEYLLIEGPTDLTVEELMRAQIDALDAGGWTTRRSSEDHEIPTKSPNGHGLRLAEKGDPAFVVNAKSKDGAYYGRFGPVSRMRRRAMVGRAQRKLLETPVDRDHSIVVQMNERGDYE